MTTVNKELINYIMNNLPADKKQSLMNACQRNALLTSYYGLDNLTFSVFVEGFLIELEGCRVKWSVFAKDNDGELIITRKPNKDKMHFLYKQCDTTYRVCDLDKIIL